LAILLGIIGVVGVLIVHRQTAVIVKGYELTTLIEKVEDYKETNRKLRIHLEEERLPQTVAARARAMGIELGSQAGTIYTKPTSVKEFYEFSTDPGADTRPERRTRVTSTRIQELKGEGR
jgi:hypothetical protein